MAVAVPVKKAWIEALDPDGTTPMGTKQDHKTGAILEVRGAPASSGAWSTVAYDSYLILHEGNQNHTLTLVLKIHLNPVSTPMHCLHGCFRQAISSRCRLVPVAVTSVAAGPDLITS